MQHPGHVRIIHLSQLRPFLGRSNKGVKDEELIGSLPQSLKGIQGKCHRYGGNFIANKAYGTWQ